MSTQKAVSRGLIAVSLAFALLFVIAVAHAATANATARTLPSALRPVLYLALANDAARPVIGKDGCATLARQALTACFDAHGARLSDGKGPGVSIDLAAFGRTGALTGIPSDRPAVEGRRVTYAHGAIREWWRVLPVGFEQGFTVRRRPPGYGPLRLELATNRPAAGAGADLAWGRIRYGGLVVTDANGHRVRASLRHAGHFISISVDDKSVHYPLTVDPLVWIEQKVTASNGSSNSLFGSSVAISATNALVGAPSASTNGLATGVVYAFSESNGIWAQTQTLTAMSGAAGDMFGSSVALDGSTALIGAPDASVNGFNNEGAVYVFTLSGDTWTQRAKLVRSTDLVDSRFGLSVALSGDTALVGGSASQNAVYVFTGSGGAWTQSAILGDSISGDGFGEAVTLAPGAATALVGAPAANSNQGAAYVITNCCGTGRFMTQLTASDGAANDAFGTAVGLSSGGMALVGAPHATVRGASNSGAVYVYANAAGSWNQTQKLSPSDGSPDGEFGSSLSVSADGLLVGTPLATVGQNSEQGAVYAFTASNGSWAETQKITASDGASGDQFGASLSLLGTIDAVGAPGAAVNQNIQQGATYFHGENILAAAATAPASVNSGAQYTSQFSLSNASPFNSANISLLVPVPNGTSYVSSIASQGTCGIMSTMVTCDFGPVAGDGGTAMATVKLKATGMVGSTVDNTASVSGATPALTASSPTKITSGGGGGGGSGGGGGAASPATLAFLALALLYGFTRRIRKGLRRTSKRA